MPRARAWTVNSGQRTVLTLCFELIGTPRASVADSVRVPATVFSLLSLVRALRDSLSVSVLVPAPGSVPFTVPIVNAFLPSLAFFATFAAISSFRPNELLAEHVTLTAIPFDRLRLPLVANEHVVAGAQLAPVHGGGQLAPVHGGGQLAPVHGGCTVMRRTFAQNATTSRSSTSAVSAPPPQSTVSCSPSAAVSLSGSAMHEKNPPHVDWSPYIWSLPAPPSMVSAPFDPSSLSLPASP